MRLLGGLLELLQQAFGAYVFALGPRAAIGGVLAEATANAPFPARGGAASMLSWDVAGDAALSRALGKRFWIALRLQAGYAHGVRLASDAGELARLHGLFAAVVLSLELRLTH